MEDYLVTCLCVSMLVITAWGLIFTPFYRPCDSVVSRRIRSEDVLIRGMQEDE